jgi:hypothetical protein
MRGTRPFVVTACTDSRGRGGHLAFAPAVHPEGDPQSSHVPGLEVRRRADEEVLGEGRWEKRQKQQVRYWGDTVEQRPAVDPGGTRPWIVVR